MKRKIHLIINILLLFALLLPSTVAPVLAAAGSVQASRFDYLSRSEREIEWKRVSPQGEEFSILTPVTPALIKLGTNYLVRGDERVQEHRSYGGYAGDFIFYIESYKAARPQKLSKVLEEDWRQPRVFESEIKIDGFSVEQYRLARQNFYGKALAVVTKRHVYLITLASKDDVSAAVERFISSLKLGDNLAVSDTGQVLNVKDSPLYQSALSGEAATAEAQDQVFNPKAVSRKAMIVSRPEPMYTEEARQNQVMGTVVLRGVFGADGQVKNLKVIRGLDSGLTGKAIEAALSIRFFPAEKDGQAVSQSIQIEYNFNLY